MKKEFVWQTEQFDDIKIVYPDGDQKAYRGTSGN